MNRDELINLSAAELGRLTADELAVVERHFGITDRDALVQRLVEEATEMWSAPSEAPVEPKDWPTTHLHLVLQVHRMEEGDRAFDERRQAAMELVDSLDAARRALLCWRFHVTDRGRVAAMTVAATLRAMEEGLVDETVFREAAAAVIDFEITVQIDEIDEIYFNALRGG